MHRQTVGYNFNTTKCMCEFQKLNAQHSLAYDYSSCDLNITIENTASFIEIYYNVVRRLKKKKKIIKLQK